jgi:hypothetical protein
MRRSFVRSCRRSTRRFRRAETACSRSTSRGAAVARDALIGLIGQAYWDAYSTIAVLQTVLSRRFRSGGIDRRDVDRADVPGADRSGKARAGRVQGERSPARRLLSRDARERAAAPEGEPHQAVARRDGRRAARRSNGLLLSPHIDHLFDEGYITFSSTQELVIVPRSGQASGCVGHRRRRRVGEFSESRTPTWTTTALMCSSALF